ncbi:MAG: tripartite tricarboxylate transporter substrate binding protein [Pseudolabrys sp.]|nr:tripartite tricarboxylate transporter substrate binding protein [Pseudolabrys sp.]MCW5684729.1 tripartite tricarboxylate transporter substrate binding protein [Pseudolabrys sp.]
MTRKFYAVVLCALSLLCVLPVGAYAQYPNRPIRLIVPFAAGGGVDLMARLAAQALSEELKENVIVENQPGASGTLATMNVAKADPDGYTLMFHTTSSSVINAVTFTNLKYDPLKALVPVTLVSQFPLAVFTYPELPAKNMAEFVALLKANPGKYNYGSSGYGSIVHLGAELFKSLAHVDIKHIPYKGNAPALTDLLAHRIEMIIDGVPPQVANVEAGKIRALAVTTAKRSDKLPNVPTMIESGIAGYELSFWTAIFAPAGTPKPIVDLIASKLGDAMKKQKLIARMKDLGADGVGSSPEALDRFWHQEIDRYRKIVETSGIRLEVN